MAWPACNLPAGGGGACSAGAMRTEQKAADPAFARPQGKSPACCEIIQPFAMKRAGDDSDRAAVEGFFHCPEKITLMAEFQPGDDRGIDTCPNKPGRVQRQWILPCHLTPDNRAGFCVQPPRDQGKHHPKGGGAVAIGSSLYLVQRPEFQPPARQVCIKRRAAGRKTALAGGGIVSRA